MQEQRPTSILFGPFAGQPSRRLQPRNALRWPVTIQIAGGSERQGVTVDLSAEGLSLSTDRPITPGSRCTLLLWPTPDEDALRLEVKAVYSSYTAPGDFRIGMAFLPQDAEGRDRLRAVATARA
jgi:hypothetical protein